MAISATLIGGPTLHLHYGGLSILTDPTFDAPGDYPGPVELHKLTGPALPPATLGAIDLVLLSHDQHADNLDHSGRELVERAPQVLSTAEAAARIPGVTALENWSTVTIGRTEVTGVPALHGPPGCEPITGTVTGFVLRAPGEPVVYISGDNASVELVAEIAEREGPFDIAVLHTGAANPGRFGDVDVTLNARTAVEAARALGQAEIVAVHAEGWAHFSETTERLALLFGYAGLSERLHIPVKGETFSI